MPLSKPLKTQEKSLSPVLPAIPAPPPGPVGRKGRPMMTFDDLFGAVFGMFPANSIGWAKRGGRKRRL